MASDAPSPEAILNINVGILGHVDSGKTSLVRALSTHLSTAALDKHPQSVERGITLDLGFSAFLTDIPSHIIDMMLLVVDAVKGIQTQTAECLVVGEITTNSMIVVLNKIDMLPEAGRDREVEKVTARIRKVLASTKFADAPFVALSAAPGGTGKLGAAAPVLSDTSGVKAQSDTVATLVETMKSRVQLPERTGAGPFLFAVDHCFPIKGQGTVLTGTVLSGSCRINDSIELPELRVEKKVKSMQMFKKAVSCIRQGDRAGICVAGLDPELMERGIACTPGSVPSMPAAIALVKKIRFFRGNCESGSKFHISVGHNTVMGTAVFFGAVELARKHIGATPHDSTGAGRDDADSVSADIVAADLAKHAIIDGTDSSIDGSVPVVGSADRDKATAGAGRASAVVPHAGTSSSSNSAVGSGSRGAATTSEAAAMEVATRQLTTARGIPPLDYDWSAEYLWQDELLGGRKPLSAAPAGPTAPTGDASAPKGGASRAAATTAPKAEPLCEWQWAALTFDTPIVAPLSSMIIGSHLDGDVHANACRLAFYGRLVQPLSGDTHSDMRRLNLYKTKCKVGAIDRVEDKEGGGKSVSVIGRSLFKKETDMSQFVGLMVHTRAGQVGIIESAFGKSGKFKVTFRDPLSVSLAAAAAAVREDVRHSAGLPPDLLAAIGSVDSLWGDSRVWVAASEAALPPIVAGEPLFFRFRKYMHEGKGAPAGAKGKPGSKAHGIVQ